MLTTLSTWLLTMQLAALATATYQMSSECLTSSIQRIDPILTPGAISNHVHVLFGGSNIDVEVANGAMAESECTSCDALPDFSMYWIPNLYAPLTDGTFLHVGDVHFTARYQWTETTEGDPTAPFPPDFRLIAGDQTLRSPPPLPLGKQRFNCGLTYPFYLAGDDKQIKGQGFPVDTRCEALEAYLEFPECSNGQGDSPDHMSHMSYKVNGACPETHPTEIAHFYFLAEWDLRPLWERDDLLNRSQPLVWSNGDTTGHSFHGDFIEGWHRDKFELALQDCRTMTDLYTPSLCKHLADNPDADRCRKTPRINEVTFGTTPLAKLPGVNELSSGPDPVQPQADPDEPAILPASVATTYVASEIQPFTTLPVTKTLSLGEEPGPTGSPKRPDESKSKPSYPPVALSGVRRLMPAATLFMTSALVLVHAL